MTNYETRQSGFEPGAARAKGRDLKPRGGTPNEFHEELEKQTAVAKRFKKCNIDKIQSCNPATCSTRILITRVVAAGGR